MLLENAFLLSSGNSTGVLLLVSSIIFVAFAICSLSSVPESRYELRHQSTVLIKMEVFFPPRISILPYLNSLLIQIAKHKVMGQGPSYLCLTAPSMTGCGLWLGFRH